MSDPDAWSGRRDNGLVAEDYALIGPVDVASGEHLLTTLAARGIAAYLERPFARGPEADVASAQVTALAKLFADREHLAATRIIVTIVTGTAPTGDRAGGPGDLDVDAAFAGIVAGLHVRDTPEAPAWPGPGPDRSGNETDADGDQPSLLDALDRFGADLPDDEDDEEGFTPPPAPPLPHVSPLIVFSVLTIIAGFALFLWPGLAPVSSTAALFCGFAAVVGGFLVLVWHLKPEPDDNDPDDGARI